VRVEDLMSGLVGFVAADGVHAGLVGNNPNTPWNEGDAYATCMVFTTAMPGEVPLWVLQAGAAREINFAIQFGYGTMSGGNVAEPAFSRGGAVWMEDEVFDQINSNYGLLWPSFNSCMGQYQAASDRYWITWRGLTERYTSGVGGGAEQVMEDFFESLSQNSAGGLLPAMNSALVNKGTTLPEAYHAYAVAAKFSKNCGGGYGYPYCFREGANYVAAAGIPAVHGSVAAVGGSHAGTVPDNYALNWVNLPLGGGPYDITLGNNSGGQFRGSVVCDTGATLTVTPFPQVVGAGDATLLANYNPAGCTSLVAVITNQAQTAANPSSCTSRGYQITVSEPAPSMAGSGMVVAPRLAGVGEVVTFTARLINSGTQLGTVVFSDPLPPGLQLVGTPVASSGSPTIVSGQTITWTGVVQSGESVLITFSAEVMTTAVIINNAQLDDGQGNIYTFLAIVNGQYSYFPIVRQN
jgi:uncharacterized repeat protein (TIGR01451 family)